MIGVERLVLAAVCAGVLLTASMARGQDYRAALVRAGLPGEDPGLVDRLKIELTSAGYAVSELDAVGLCDRSGFGTEGPDLLVLPSGADLPGKAAPAIEAHLRAGGDIIALNTPLWQRALIRADGEWVVRDEYQRAHAADPPENVLFRFADGSISSWRRAYYPLDSTSTYETTAEGPAPGARSLHSVISNLRGWDNFGAYDLKDPFPKGHTLTVFSAKGGPGTSQLAIEWDERDGSRWIAVIPLSQEWRQYVLTPADFRYWQSTAGRGGRGDSFKPENAVAVSFGVALTHTDATGGTREFWIGPFGTAQVRKEHADILGAFDQSTLDTLSPSYKLFDCSDVASIKTRGDQLIVQQAEIRVPKQVRSPHPRPSGGGFDKGRDWRWIPLLEARTANGEWRGTPATLMVHANGPYKGGVWASFGFDGREDPAVPKMVGEIARRMKNGVFILDGGTNYYTYFDKQNVRRGVRVANLRKSGAASVTAKVTCNAGQSDQAVEFPISLAPGEVRKVEDNWDIHRWPEGGLTVSVELIEDGKVIDRVGHEVNVWRPKEKKDFVTVENGEFMLNGRRWRAHGVNYMPSSGVAAEDGEYFEHWIGARSYDPEVIDRDLDHCQDLGLNSVSIFIYSAYTEHQNLLDLLRRLEKRGMKANLSLRPVTPLDFLWPEISKIITYYRLWDNDTVFAYDLAWEPMFGNQGDRVIWDGEWEKWIVERYGSIENAEKDWAFKVPRNASGKITNPLPHQIDTDGEWRAMTAAYRRFLDTLLYQKYSAARRLVRRLDKNHLVSFRMAEAGNPNYRWDGRIAYDWPYLSAAVDILEPEAYGRIGDWEKVKPGWFEFEYARWAAPEKPMIWAEMGVHAWDISRMQVSAERLDYQAMYYTQFYRLLDSSGADGIYFWWYPGGFRCGENSDYGIVNPDGSDRPVSKVIRGNAKRYLEGPSSRPIDHWIEFDRDAHPDGIAGIYDKAKDEFWSAIERGKAPGLRTAGAGTTSANCPALAVGNVPWTGKNPPKYLDAAIDSVLVKGLKDPDDAWVRVAKGGTVQVKAGEPVVARVEFTDLGEATLLSIKTPGEKGGVCLVAEGPEKIQAGISADLPRHASGRIEQLLLARSVEKPTKVTITFEALERTTFGERYEITLEGK